MGSETDKEKETIEPTYGQPESQYKNPELQQVTHSPRVHFTHHPQVSGSSEHVKPSV